MITAAGIFLGIAFLCFSGVPILILAFQHKLLTNADLNRQIWLVIMALMVCTVGITNSMLMSVSERFREIGTMKCLGALNSLIVRLFLIEALFMGIVSSFGGWLLGFVAMFFVRWASMGWADGVRPLTGGVILASLFGSIVIGGILDAHCGPVARPARRADAACRRAQDGSVEPSEPNPGASADPSLSGKGEYRYRNCLPSYPPLTGEGRRLRRGEVIWRNHQCQQRNISSAPRTSSKFLLSGKKSCARWTGST